MGKKSKKKGGKMTTFTDNSDKTEIKDIAKAEVKADDICEELVNEPEEEEESESSKFLSMSLSERHAQGIELKAKRDEMVDILSKDEDVDEKDFQLAQLLMAELTIEMAGFGIFEEEQHSSLVYCEENADKLYKEGGWEKFKERMDWASATGKMQNIMKDVELEAKLEKLKQDGDNEGYLRLMKKRVQEVDSAMDAALASQGLPPKDREDIFIGTLIDDELFQPPPIRPDCAVCMITLPARNHTSYMPCCGKSTCYCNDDPDAYMMMGGHYHQGWMGVEQNYEKAVEHWKKAVELGSNFAHHSLSVAYLDGTGVEQDDKLSFHHLRLAAIGGVVEARYELGCRAYNDPKAPIELVMKHYVLAAEYGHDDALDRVKAGYKHGCVTKDVFAKALRAHQAAKDAVKSPQRDAAARSSFGTACRMNRNPV